MMRISNTKKLSLIISVIVIALFFQGFMDRAKSLFYTDWGDKLYASKNYTGAFKKYKSAAELNDGYACYKLYIQYKEGKGIKTNLILAKKMLDKSVSLGYPQAQAILGVTLIGQRKDIAKAIEILKKSALQKNILAYIQLSSIYLYGIGVKKDRGKAQAYIDLANANGAHISLPKY